MSNPTLVHGKRQSLGKTIWKHRASYLLMAPYFICSSSSLCCRC